MTRNKNAEAEWRTAGHFVPLPYAVMKHPNFLNLTPIGAKLLLELCSQIRFKGSRVKNNGDLCVAWEILRLKGWGSKGSISRARDELKHYGFIIMTKAGSIKKPALYALTFFSINDCDGKIDCKPTTTPRDDWKHVVDKFDRRGDAHGTKQGRNKKNRPYFRSKETSDTTKNIQTDLIQGRMQGSSDLKQGPFSDSPGSYVNPEALVLTDYMRHSRRLAPIGCFL